MKISDDRLKIWIELGKWAVVSVGLVIMTTIIDSGFKDREVGMNEIKEYDKYVNLVTDNSKISERRLLAQYFAYVTPSEKLKSGWKDYLVVVEEEMAELELRQEEIQEQLADTSNLAPEMREQLQIKINKIEEELTPTFEKRSVAQDFNAALDWEKIGFQKLVDRNLEEAISAFKSAERSYNSFHQVYEIGRYLRSKKSSTSQEGDEFWKEIYQTILEEYSWKMPEPAKNSLEQLSQ
jgi:hypothetical protein